MTERLQASKPVRTARSHRLTDGLGLLACVVGLFGATQACGSSGDSDGTAGKSGSAGSQASAGTGGSAVGTGATSGNPGTSGSSTGTAGTNPGSSGSSTTGGAPGTAGSGSGTAGTAGTGNPPTGGSGTGGSPPASGDSVLQRNNNASRDGMFVQPKLTKAAIPMLAADATFNAGATFSGNVWASPLYLAPAAATGKGLFFIVTTSNDVIALDETTGMKVWSKSIGTPAQANGVTCGNIHPLGILSTPVIDAATRTIYVAGAVGNASTIQKHVIMAYNADDGTEKPGWPVDTTGLTSGGTTFNAPAQNQRSALSLVGGKVYVGYGGHVGDCDNYHGWIVAVDAADPTKKAGWATLGRGEAIWAAGGFASDGTSIFPVTGNHTGTAGGDARATADSEAVVRLTGMAELTRNDQNLYFPTTWKTMDSQDADLGGSNSTLVTIDGATPATYVAAVAKDGNMYLLNPTNLGGMGGHVLTFKVSNGGAMAVKTSPTTYKTAKGTHYVFSTDSGAVCPGSGGGKSIVSVLLKADGGKVTASSEWCAPLTGAVTAPIATTTDGTADAAVWFVDSGKLTAVNGDDGTKLFASTDTCAGVRQWTSPIAVKGRIVVGGDKNLCAWATK